MRENGDVASLPVEIWVELRDVIENIKHLLFSVPQRCHFSKTELFFFFSNLEMLDNFPVTCSI